VAGLRTIARWPLLTAGLAAAFGCALLLADAPPEPGAPATQPAPPETLGELRQRLAAAAGRGTPREQVALRCGAEIVLALGAGNIDGAVRFVDPVGYQPLPLDGPLPETPERPIAAEALAERLRACRLEGVERLPATSLEVLNRDGALERFPAVGRWMQRQDVVVLVHGADTGGMPWLTQRACLVVRVRAGRPSVLGGNLLAALRSAE
jgi:hypothetical protein